MALEEGGRTAYQERQGAQAVAVARVAGAEGQRVPGAEKRFLELKVRNS